jgi:hypothetical protein
LCDQKFKNAKFKMQQDICAVGATLLLAPRLILYFCILHPAFCILHSVNALPA